MTRVKLKLMVRKEQASLWRWLGLSCKMFFEVYSYSYLAFVHWSFELNRLTLRKNRPNNLLKGWSFKIFLSFTHWVKQLCFLGWVKLLLLHTYLEVVLENKGINWAMMGTITIRVKFQIVLRFTKKIQLFRDLCLVF